MKKRKFDLQLFLFILQNILILGITAFGIWKVFSKDVDLIYPASIIMIGVLVFVIAFFGTIEFLRGRLGKNHTAVLILSLIPMLFFVISLGFTGYFMFIRIPDSMMYIPDFSSILSFIIGGLTLVNIYFVKPNNIIKTVKPVKIILIVLEVISLLILALAIRAMIVYGF